MSLGLGAFRLTTHISPPPGPTVSGTTSNCGAWYLVPPGVSVDHPAMCLSSIVRLKGNLQSSRPEQ